MTSADAMQDGLAVAVASEQQVQVGRAEALEPRIVGSLGIRARQDLALDDEEARGLLFYGRMLREVSAMGRARPRRAWLARSGCTSLAAVTIAGSCVDLGPPQRSRGLAARAASAAIWSSTCSSARRRRRRPSRARTRRPGDPGSCGDQVDDGPAVAFYPPCAKGGTSSRGRRRGIEQFVACA